MPAVQVRMQRQTQPKRTIGAQCQGQLWGPARCCSTQVSTLRQLHFSWQPCIRPALIAFKTWSDLRTLRTGLSTRRMAAPSCCCCPCVAASLAPVMCHNAGPLTALQLSDTFTTQYTTVHKLLLTFLVWDCVVHGLQHHFLHSLYGGQSLYILFQPSCDD